MRVFWMFFGCLGVAIATYSGPTAMIVSSSKYYFNYRHSSDALTVYRALRANGVPDSFTSLWLADAHMCDPRSRRPGEMYINDRMEDDTWCGGRDVEVDVSGSGVHADLFLRALSGEHSALDPPGSFLPRSPSGDLLLYLNGHGGDGYFKFRDAEEISSLEFARALQRGYENGVYSRAFLVLDTCQAATLFEPLAAMNVPNVYHISTSDRGLSSYATRVSSVHGVSFADGFIATVGNWFRDQARHSTLGNLYSVSTPQRVLSQVLIGHSTNTSKMETTWYRPLESVLDENVDFLGTETLAMLAAVFQTLPKGGPSVRNFTATKHLTLAPFFSANFTILPKLHTISSSPPPSKTYTYLQPIPSPNSTICPTLKTYNRPTLQQILHAAKNLHEKPCILLLLNGTVLPAYYFLSLLIISALIFFALLF